MEEIIEKKSIPGVQIKPDRNRIRWTYIKFVSGNLGYTYSLKRANWDREEKGWNGKWEPLGFHPFFRHQGFRL